VKTKPSIRRPSHTAIRAAAPHLTPRQQQILQIIADGSRNVDVADALKISVRTVNNHLDRIYRTLGVNNRIAALRAMDELQRNLQKS
jgi:DNA-binding NarL/FixJ family response regulator